MGESPDRSRHGAPIAHGLIERLDALPTPSPLAMRLLAAANDDGTSARDLVEIIRQDSALTAKVIALCRRGPRGRQLDVASLDRAVVLLGFSAVRSAALSVEFVSTLGGTTASNASGFDPLRFWRHALAKAIVAESAAKLARGGLAGRAFVAGLLHDLGALGLSRAAPALFDRACEESERTGRSLDATSSELFGLSCAAVGARLAQRWNLPEEMQEAIRLRGTDAVAAEGPHRAIVLLAELADQVVRRRHLGGAGFGPEGLGSADPTNRLVAALEIDGAKFAAAIEGLFDDVAGRAESLGLSTSTPASLAVEAIDRANRRLESMHVVRGSGDPIEDFDAAADPVATLGLIVRSITRLAGRTERLLAVVPGLDASHAEIREFDAHGALAAGRVAGDGDVDGDTAARRWCEMRAKGGRPGSLRLSCRGSTIATIHRADGDVLPAAALAQAPTSLWAFALASSVDRQRAQRSADRAADALRALSIARDRLVRDRALASIGEIAAGLAHELNNPLTVVSGRAQILRKKANDASAVAGLDEIIAASERASGLVSQLLRTVRPGSPIIRPTSASEIISLAMRFLPLHSREIGANANASPASGDGADRTARLLRRISVRIDDAGSSSPACLADPAQLADAIAEVLQNALDATAEGCVEVIAQSDASNGRCLILVRDAGPGFSDRALQHALDPFFSERRSGRGAGLGLAKARSITEACGGGIELRNAPEGGALVTITLPSSVQLQRPDERGDDRSGPCRLRREAA